MCRHHDCAMTFAAQGLRHFDRAFFHAAGFKRRQQLDYGEPTLSHDLHIQAAMRAASLK